MGWNPVKDIGNGVKAVGGAVKDVAKGISHLGNEIGQEVKYGIDQTKQSWETTAKGWNQIYKGKWREGFGTIAGGMYQGVVSDYNHIMGIDPKKPMGPGAPMPTMQDYATQGPGAYPAYPNEHGLGDVAAFSGQSQQGTNTASLGSEQNPITLDVGNTSSRGGNPWTFSGEANARGGGMDNVYE